MNTVIYNRYTDERFGYNHSVRWNHHNNDYAMQSHDLCELLFIKRGNMSYTVDGRRYKLAPNTLVFTRPFDIHALEVDGDDEYERYAIVFDEKLLPFDIYARIPQKLNVIYFDGNQSVIGLFDKMDFYCEHFSGDELGLILKNLTKEIFYNIVIEASKAHENTYTQTNKLVCAAISYIEENFLTITGVEEICRELYITKSHLHHLFMKHLRISPKKFIISKRLALAKHEIQAGGRPTEVYTRCGFSDYSSFYRAYTSHFGYKPSEKFDAERTVFAVGKTVIDIPPDEQGI